MCEPWAALFQPQGVHPRLCLWLWLCPGGGRKPAFLLSSVLLRSCVSGKHGELRKHLRRAVWGSQSALEVRKAVHVASAQEPSGQGHRVLEQCPQTSYRFIRTKWNLHCTRLLNTPLCKHYLGKNPKPGLKIKSVMLGNQKAVCMSQAAPSQEWLEKIKVTSSLLSVGGNSVNVSHPQNG